ncbi:restriction endonuclease subunit S [Lactobacillus johnsonii]|uniref:restriction endonuclease subunit S n=1 Tax=Lactobacillus johnsonii TaxID=33959 RepID=UPI003D079003
MVWEQRKLGDLTQRIKSYPISHDAEINKITGTKYIHYGDIHTGKLKRITNEKILPNINDNNYIPLKSGDVIVADASEDYKGIADACVIDLMKEHYKIVSGLHTIVFRPNEKLKSDFLYTYLHTSIFKHYGYRVGTGLKVFGISYNNLSNMKIKLPKIDEQNKVDKIINIVTNLVTLQQRKVNNYFQYKTQLINTIFENKNWQMIKLKDVLSVPKKELANVTTKSQIMTVKLNLGGIVDGANRDTLNPSATKYYIRHAGQFIFGKQNFFNGSMAIVPKAMDEKVTSQDVPALNINNEKINSKFLLYYLSRKNFYKHTERFATGTGSKRLHVDTLLNLKIRIPDISYQNQIVSTLTLLDKKLQLETAKLNKLKQLKQFLLQNMFI